MGFHSGCHARACSGSFEAAGCPQGLIQPHCQPWSLYIHSVDVGCGATCPGSHHESVAVQGLAPSSGDSYPCALSTVTHSHLPECFAGAGRSHLGSSADAPFLVLSQQVVAGGPRCGQTPLLWGSMCLMFSSLQEVANLCLKVCACVCSKLRWGSCPAESKTGGAPGLQQADEPSLGSVSAGLVRGAQLGLEQPRHAGASHWQ